jgi:hypothetical protein
MAGRTAVAKRLLYPAEPFHEQASHAVTWGLTATNEEARDEIRPGNRNDMAAPVPLVDAILQQILQKASIGR